MDVYTKRTSQKEADICVLAASSNIAPKVLSVTRGDSCIITSELYPSTIYDEVTRPGFDKKIIAHIIDQAKEKLTALHNAGIIHGDLSEENIVFNPDTNAVRIIDFGLSRYISELSERDIEELKEELYEGEKYADSTLSGIEYIKSLEHGTLTFLGNYYTKR